MFRIVVQGAKNLIDELGSGAQWFTSRFGAGIHNLADKKTFGVDCILTEVLEIAGIDIDGALSLFTREVGLPKEKWTVKIMKRTLL